MKPKTVSISRNIGAILLGAATLYAGQPTPWDDMIGRSSTGSITVTTLAGKKLTRIGTASFSESDVHFGYAGPPVARQDVKEVVIREIRKPCCEPLMWGMAPLFMLVGDIPDGSVPKWTLIFLPVAVGMAAVTATPVLAIEGVRKIKPAKLIYRVVP